MDQQDTKIPGAAREGLESLRRDNEALRVAVAARDNFIAVAAHELRNPMTPMIGQVERLLASMRAGKLSAGQVETRLNSIRETMNHYVRRATTLLDVSRITAGKLNLEVEPVDIAALARDVAAAYAGAAHHAGCTLAVSAPSPLAVIGDRLAIEQIIDNLLSNAIKYGPEAPVEIAVEREGDLVRLQVRDHGAGIPPEDRERIFQAFEQAVQFSDRRSGFGVGLWVVCQLVRAMGGAISVEDAPGGGSLFVVRLPCQPKEDAP